MAMSSVDREGGNVFGPFKLKAASRRKCQIDHLCDIIREKKGAVFFVLR